MSIFKLKHKESDEKKIGLKKIILGVFTPRGSHSGYPGVPSTLKFQKKKLEKYSSVFFES